MKTLLILSTIGLLVSCLAFRESPKNTKPFVDCVQSKGGFTDSNCYACEHLLKGVSEEEVERMIVSQN